MNMPTTPTLWHVLTDGDRLPESVAVRLKGLPDLGGLRQQVSKVTLPGFADDLEGAVSDSVQDLLATPLDAVIGSALGKYQELLEYSDPVKHPPEEIALVPLLTHTIESVHHPYLEVRIASAPPLKIEFEARAVLLIDGATLKIHHARIWEIRSGSCKGTGSLSLGSVVLIEPKTRSVPLPGVMRFPAGVPIAPG